VKPPLGHDFQADSRPVAQPEGSGPAGIASIRSNPVSPHTARTSDSPPPDPKVVLVLQGGGALGSYQAGVFEALAEFGHAPSWLAGVSIGAINAALIAGNPPEKRVARLREFWERVTSTTSLWPRIGLPGWVAAEQHLGAASAMLLGQPGFFRPRAPLEWLRGDWLGATAPVSFYDSADLKSTLEKLVDFDRINDGPLRLSVGAVNVETGNLAYFDSANMRLGPEHIMASGALPPGLPSVEIDGEHYWDGGLVSNTPLQYVLAERPRQHSLIFQVDMFPARGRRPANLDEVGEREKDIRFSSRTRTGTNDAGERQNRRRLVRVFLDRLPEHLREDPVALQLREFASAALVDVVHLIYRPDVPQGAMKDYQFDRGSMQRRWAQGQADARVSLEAEPWNAPVDEDVGFRTFDAFAPEGRK
jgi:NTE family protein